MAPLAQRETDGPQLGTEHRGENARELLSQIAGLTARLEASQQTENRQIQLSAQINIRYNTPPPPRRH